MNRRKFTIFFIGQIIVLLILVIISIQFGSKYISLSEIMGSFFQKDSLISKIIFNVRLPRILAALIAGGVLALAGNIYQSVLQNPLAEPYLLGIANGGALFYALTLFFSSKFPIIKNFIPIITFIGSILAIYLVLKISDFRQKLLRKESIILGGIVIGTFLYALTMLVMIISGEQLENIIYFLMGNLGIIITKTNSLYFLLISFVLLIGFAIIFIFHKELNIITLGDEVAETMGLNVEKYRKFFLLLSSAMVGLIVSLCGIIGFIGLISPHIARMIVGANHKRLFPTSVLMGAILLLAADLIARTSYSFELPVGIITALIGAPYFLFLMFRRNNG